MGTWTLEVGKMAMYIAFPVAMFYFYNQPQYFENWVVNMRRELYPPEVKSHKKEIDACVRAMHAKRERELLKELEDSDDK